jgi:NADP-dependent 3-hydroxy acid dehydrogenase YdfG
MTVFQEHIAVVTGATSGIGKAIAMSLAAEGATVSLVGRRLEELRLIAASNDTRLLPYQADLSSHDGRKHLVSRLRADFKHIDILVHSAAIYARGPVSSAPADDLELQFRINVLAPYELTQTLLPMLPIQRGQIVFVNSSAALEAPENLSQYAATKHALKAIADSVRKEVNRDGIRVLSVYLGRTATPLQAAVHAMENRIYHSEDLMQPEDVAAVILSALSLPRTAEVTEVMMRSFKRLAN